MGIISPAILKAAWHPFQHMLIACFNASPLLLVPPFQDIRTEQRRLEPHNVYALPALALAFMCTKCHAHTHVHAMAGKLGTLPCAAAYYTLTFLTCSLSDSALQVRSSFCCWPSMPVASSCRPFGGRQALQRLNFARLQPRHQWRLARILWLPLHVCACNIIALANALAGATT